MCYTAMQVSTGSNDGELVKINRTSKVFLTLYHYIDYIKAS